MLIKKWGDSPKTARTFSDYVRRTRMHTLKIMDGKLLDELCPKMSALILTGPENQRRKSGKVD